MTPHLAFSLLGITGLTVFESVDRPSELVAKMLYAIFLIMGVILLINMMIALLSNTYQHVQVLAEKLRKNSRTQTKLMCLLSSCREIICVFLRHESEAQSLSAPCNKKVRKHFSLLSLPFCSTFISRMAGVPSPLLG